ncbi:MAG: MBL fold metallo-hydrolase [Candidatus Methanoplasma sp.]|jgi:phosphoribosyl 1,2-cyclic phosphodiesterase|nr:MBL fold metallo-hydrolase [Candidatus Methanoplasma sp.]
MVFKITFLGTGGGRHTTMYQTRCTGGMLIEHGTKFLHIDPGPGALVQMHRIHYDLSNTNSLIVSHAHPDHYSDAESVLEGMTLGGWKRRGQLYGSPTVIEGQGTLGPCISRYHINVVEGVSVFKPGDVFDIDGLKTEICKADHSDPTNVGFRFRTENGIVSYVSDTIFTEEIAKQYIGTRVLILPVTTPGDLRINFHMCSDDAIKFIDVVKPEVAIMIHFGIVMIRTGPKDQASYIEKKTGIKTVAADDLMIVNIGENIEFSKAEVFDDEWIPPSSI